MKKFEIWRDIPQTFSGFCHCNERIYYVENGIIMSPPSGGPAYIEWDGTKTWLIPSPSFSFERKDYNYHRLDGPAKIFYDDSEEYFIYGEEISEKDYWKHPLVLQYKLNRILEL